MDEEASVAAVPFCPRSDPQSHLRWRPAPLCVLLLMLQPISWNSPRDPSPTAVPCAGRLGCGQGGGRGGGPELFGGHFSELG